MYKVMIVDDEYVVRMDLRTLIDWKRQGFELTEDAVNGKDALLKIDEFQPDIVLLDIGMPGMDGITLMERLKERAYRGKILILSCLDDFDHVKSALVSGAQEYLLKHRLEPNMLMEALDSVVSKLEAERTQSDQIHKWEVMAADSLHMYRKKFLQQLLRGYHGDVQQISQKLDELDLDVSLQLCVMMVVSIHDIALERQRLGSRPFELLSEQLVYQINSSVLAPDLGYCFDSEDGKLSIILGFPNKPSFLYMQNLLYSVSNQIHSLMNAEFNVTAAIGVSENCADVQRLPHYYRQAQEAVNGTFFLGRNRTIHYLEVAVYNRKPAKSFKGYEERLLAAVKERKRIAEEIEDMYNDLSKQMVCLEEVKNFNFEFVSFLKKNQREYGIPEQELFGVERSPYEAVNLMETMGEVQHFLRDVTARLSGLIEEMSFTRGIRKEIAEAIEYMKNHYSANLSLEVMASYVNMNSTYFSNLFKKETQENFVTFLQKMRIEKAKLLLSNSEDKVYDIAAQVGIGNYHYFCKTFKQLTGATPVQYRTSHSRFSD